MKKYIKEFIRYVSLYVLGMVGISCYILADTFFIAKGMGTNGLTALNLCIPAYSVLYGVGMMLGIGGATRYSILREQGEKTAGKTTFTHAVVIGIIFSTVFVFAGLFAKSEVVKFLGAEGDIIEMCETYLSVLWAFAPAFILNGIVLSFLRNDGAPGLSMTGMVVGSLSNILLDWLFIFPLDMGIFGAILATGLSPVISLAVYAPRFFMKKNGFTLGKTKINAKLCLKILLIGLPFLIAEVSTATLTFTFNQIMLELENNVGVSAYGVIANVVIVVIAVFNGVASGAQPLFTQYSAINDEKGKKTVFTYAVVLVGIIGIAIYASAYLCADVIASIFNTENNTKMQELAVRGTKLYFMGAMLVGYNVLISAYFAAREKNVQAQIITILRGVAISLPMAIILSRAYGTDGLWISFPISEFIVLIVGIVFLIAEKIKRKKLTTCE